MSSGRRAVPRGRRAPPGGRPRRHPDASIPAEVRLVDGEVWLRNPATFTGYFDDDATTKETLTADGWLKTGDLATCGADDSYTFAGRKKLAIRRRGEMIAPGEVESALEAHPAVLEAGVVAAQDADGLTKARAFVVLKAGWKASDDLAATLVEFVRKRGAAYKAPAVVEFVDDLPKTVTGKVQRFRLRAAEPA